MLRLTSFRQKFLRCHLRPRQGKTSPTRDRFPEKRSAVWQLLFYINKVHENFDTENQKLSALYLDFSEAIGTGPHCTLLRKFSDMGIGGTSIKLPKSYLTNILQCVQIQDKRSINDVVTSRAQQGPVLDIPFFDLYERFTEWYTVLSLLRIR